MITHMLRLAFAFLTLCGTAAFAQSVISARAGLIHYVEGDVYLDDKLAEVGLATFTTMKNGSVLRTAAGRAELLLNPGVFLRLGEDSAVKLINGALEDVRIELLAGSAVVESNRERVEQEDAVTILYNGSSAHLRKAGIYRFETDPALLRVYSGEALVTSGTSTVTVKGSREAALDAPMAAEKFNSKQTDALTRWSRRRAEYIAMASMSSSKSLLDNGNTWNRAGWYYNPYFGMMTFIPGGGVWRTPYGFRLYAPNQVWQVYSPPAAAMAPMGGASMGGYRTAPQASGGYSGVIASGGGSSRSAAPAASAPAAAPAPISRESGRVGGGR